MAPAVVALGFLVVPSAAAALLAPSLAADAMKGPSSSSPSDIVEFKGDLYFAATGSLGSELYRYDGSKVRLVKDILPGYKSSDPDFMTVPVAHLISKEYAAERRKLIDPGRASRVIEPGAGGGRFRG